MKHSVKAVPVLAAALLFLTGCAQPADPASVTEPDVMTEDAQTEAVTEAEPETEAAGSEVTAASDRPYEEESRVREQEAQAKRQVEYEKKHQLYTENGGIMVEQAESWQDGYAQLLESGDAAFLLSPYPDPALDPQFALLQIEETETPDLVIHSPSHGCVLIFRYEDGKVIYADQCDLDSYSLSFSYRPYRGDLGSSKGSVMNEGIYFTFWHIGESEHCSVPHHTFGQVKDITPETAERFDITIDYDEEQDYTTSYLGDSWVHVSPEANAAFKPITPDNIALLYKET